MLLYDWYSVNNGTCILRDLCGDIYDNLGTVSPESVMICGFKLSYIYCINTIHN